jgi:hypothetical protein
MEHKIGHFVVLFSFGNANEIAVFWDGTQCGLAKFNEGFGGISCLRFQSRIGGSNIPLTLGKTTGMYDVRFQMTVIFAASNF